jgi:hypothetical protein
MRPFRQRLKPLRQQEKRIANIPRSGSLGPAAELRGTLAKLLGCQAGEGRPGIGKGTWPGLRHYLRRPGLAARK